MVFSGTFHDAVHAGQIKLIMLIHVAPWPATVLILRKLLTTQRELGPKIGNEGIVDQGGWWFKLAEKLAIRGPLLRCKYHLPALLR